MTKSTVYLVTTRNAWPSGCLLLMSGPNPASTPHPVTSQRRTRRPAWCHAVISHRPAANTTGGGSCFRVTDTRLGRLGLPSTYFRVVNESNVNDFVFVMGLSDSHYLESLDAIASVQKYMPGHVIIVYDLGLTDEQLNKVSTKLCSSK